KGDFRRLLGAELDRDDPAVELFQAGAEDGAAGPAGAGDEADVFLLAGKKTAHRREAELAGEERVVADLGMGIDRKMVGIKRTVTAHEHGHALINRPGQR